MSAYPWHIIGGVTVDGLSFRTWRRGLVYTAEDTQDAKAKGVKINVAAHAQEIAQGIVDILTLPEGIERAEAVRGYLNLYFSTKDYSRRVIDTVLNQGDDYGKGTATGERVMVEFSQPNTHKAFHVGHLRNVILGNSICNILEKSGDGFSGLRQKRRVRAPPGCREGF